MNISNNPNDELSEYEKLQDTGYYDRRLDNSRTSCMELIIHIMFENLYFWGISK